MVAITVQSFMKVT